MGALSVITVFHVNALITNRTVKKHPNTIAVTSRKDRRTSNFTQIETDRTCSQLYTCIYEAVQFESKLRHEETRSAAARPQSHLRYRPTVFLLHLCHVALPAPGKEILGALLKSHYFTPFFFQNGIKFEIVRI